MRDGVFRVSAAVQVLSELEVRRSGHAEDAVAHFREAHRLQPENWTYKRQAWSFVHPLQRANEVYDSDWASEVEASGAENYYPMIDL